VAFTQPWQLQLDGRASRHITVSNGEKTMLAWESMSETISDDKFSPDEQSRSDSATILYQLTVAFPTLAGAILTAYSVFLSGSSALRIRLK
jgi:hypothetical protein